MTSYAVVDKIQKRSVTMTLDQETYDELAEAAKAAKVTVGAYAREVVEKHLTTIAKLKECVAKLQEYADKKAPASGGG